MTDDDSDPQAAFDSKRFLANLTQKPGVYEMIGADGEIIYVGKARNLKKRVSSYFLRASGNSRTERMVDAIADIRINITDTEDQALLLESNLIKRHRPRYNVVFKDDKSYPYIAITNRHAYPRVHFHRGARKKTSSYFGPYPGAWAARQTMGSLQKLFQLRPCTDSYFANRSRPCLQHQIRRCSAPCVGLISEADYARDVHSATQVLLGKGERLRKDFERSMEQASQALDFEAAAKFRDQLAALARVTAQGAAVSGQRSLDAIVVDCQDGLTGVCVATIRHGSHVGHRSYFPAHAGSAEPPAVLAAFVGQYYEDRDPPPEIIVSQLPDDADWLAAALSDKLGRAVTLKPVVRGDRARVLTMARDTLTEAIGSRLARSETAQRRCAGLQALLDLPEPPTRLECFDISHTRGEAAVASCVVFDGDGPLKSAYRRFNIKNITPGDDYAAMHQALSRRYARLKQGEAPMPDILFIDGGAGQMTQARDVLAEAGVEGVMLVGVAKGAGRKPGLEQIVLDDGRVIRPEPNDPGLHLIQQIRDEAHRFAIEGHRGQRGKARTRSSLEDIDGLGPKRRAALLKQFGGLKRIQRASVEELKRVDGVSAALAKRIYDRYHS